MGRPREFDQQRALRQAMEIFWERGFEATTMSALTRELGIGRQSLYDTFGDRERLYRECLAEYRRHRAEDVTRLKASTGPLLPVLRRHLEGVIEEICGDPPRNSCLMLNAAVERGRDEGIQALVTAHFRALEDLVTEKLREAKASGEVTAPQSPRVLARYVLNVLNGLRVTGSFVRNRAHLQQLVTTSLAVLTPEPSARAKT